MKPLNIIDLRKASTDDIMQDIAKFQNAQKWYAPNTHTHQQCSIHLAPLFAEMARRQKEAQSC